MNFQQLYVLMFEKPDGEIMLATTRSSSGKKLVISTEENKKLLVEIGDRLLKEDFIIGYQILKTDGPPVRNYEIIEEVSMPFDVSLGG